MDASIDSISIDGLEASMNDKTSNDELNDLFIDSKIIHIILEDRQIFIEKSSI